MHVLERSFGVMGTEAHLTIVDGRPELADGAEQRLHALEQRWSRFRADSELSQLNAKAGVPVIVSSETFDLIETAIDGWTRTGGHFDPTVGRTMVAAGYDRSLSELDRSSRPSTSHVPTPGADGIVLGHHTCSVQLPVGVSLDLGGIAKGAAADLVAAELLAEGAAGACVNIGGDLAVVGAAPRPEGWRISLDCPGAATPITVVVATGAVCTTTTTKRTWNTGNGVEHHLRDPWTGAPMSSGVVSVSVISALAIQAEVLTKALCSLGLDEGVELVRQAGATGLVVHEDGSVVPMPGFEAFRLQPVAPVAG